MIYYFYNISIYYMKMAYKCIYTARPPYTCIVIQKANPVSGKKKDLSFDERKRILMHKLTSH